MNGFYIGRLAGIPTFISPWYVLLLGFFGIQIGGAFGAVFAAVVTVSILVHELGHAFVARRYDLTPTILLHGWGGLCAHRPASTDRASVFILAMGPGAGLILGGLIYLASLFIAPGWLAARPLVAYAIDTALYVNLFWSLINLVPLWPLDGGQLFGIGLKQKLSVARTHKITHITGMVFAGVGVAWGATMGSFFVMILAAMLGFQNYQMLRRAPQVRGPIPRRDNPEANAVYEQALEAMERHDWHEAARLGHQMRALNLSDKQLLRVWELLAVATTNMGEYAEAMRYIERAPDSEPVQAARERCEARLAGATA